jgi:hypothetical protein
MNKKIIFGGALLLSLILLSSSSMSISIISPISNETNLEQQNEKRYVEEGAFNGKMLLKQLFFGRNNELQLNIFTSTITTTCDEVEKTSEIYFGLSNDLDVDNDENTGVDGKDIRVQYLILPYIQTTPEFALGAIFSVSVELLGEEISSKEFSLSASIADNIITLGYESPESSSNRIPNRIQLSSVLFIRPSDKTTGFIVNMNPSYESGQIEKEIILFAGYDDSNVKRFYSFGFQPAAETQITICSTLNPNKWEYAFSTNSPFDTTFTAKIAKTVDGITKETTLTIDSLPDEISFALSLTPFSSEGGSIEYESDSMYDISVLVETDDIGQCKYAVIQNTPRSLYAKWLPSKENGFYHVNIDSDGTTIYLLNTLNEPTINLSLNELSTVDLTAFWNLTNPGNIEVFKDPSLHIDLDIIFDEWEADIDAEPTAEHIYFSWKSNVSGFLTLDTDQLPLSNIDLLVKGPENGISIFGETLAADDFHLEWTVWPLTEFHVDKTGWIDFFSISIDVYVNDQWYHIWPLF